MTIKRALTDFKWGREYKSRISKEMDKDIEFALGKQWDTEDAKALEDAGVLPITINEVEPIINLLYGLESQNRSDLRAYPEGQEDSILAEIATRLLKHALSKQAEYEHEISEMFTDGNMGGEAWIEPYLDSTRNIIIPDFKLKVANHAQFSWDPNSRKYDLSDAEFLDKLTTDLTEDQVLSLYPEADKILKKSKGGKVISMIDGGDYNEHGEHRQVEDYGDRPSQGDFQWERKGEKTMDLLEHFYKKYVDVWYVIDSRTNQVVKADSKQEAEGYVSKVNEEDPEGQITAAAVRKRVPEIWMMAIAGGCDDPLADERAWSFPDWNGWPAIPYFAKRSNAKVPAASRHYLIQGVVRQIKDLNREKNKRRTQELRHLGQSANSGWLTPENAWVNRDDVKNYGAVPGVNLEYKTDIGKPERIYPMPLSQGHAQMAQEASEDIKKATGVNPDLLAAQEGGTDSGRAIALRQKQGMVMIQRYFDHLSRTKKILARFVLSQLAKIFTRERAMRIAGDSFLQQNFQKPVMQPVIEPRTGQPVIDPATGQPAMMPVIDPRTGQPAMEYDEQAAVETFDRILNDRELAEYDVTVGEVINRETIQYANYLLLTEMAGQGMPIPPDVMIDESTLPQATKSKIKAAIMNAQMAGQPPKK